MRFSQSIDIFFGLLLGFDECVFTWKACFAFSQNEMSFTTDDVIICKQRGIILYVATFKSIEGRTFYWKGYVYSLLRRCAYGISSDLGCLGSRPWISLSFKNTKYIYRGFFMEWFLMYIKLGAFIFLSYMYSIQPPFLPKQLSHLWCLWFSSGGSSHLSASYHTHRWCQTKVPIHRKKLLNPF